MDRINKFPPGKRYGWKEKCFCKSRKDIYRKKHKILEQYSNIKIHIQKIGKLGSKLPYLIWIKCQ